jgi:hypothetical protein
MHRCHDAGWADRQGRRPPARGNRETTTRGDETVARIGPHAARGDQSMRAENRRSADEMVLKSNIVTVIGPTPPGTGVMYDAFCETP